MLTGSYDCEYLNRAGRSQAASEHHGQIQDGHCHCWAQLQQGIIINLFTAGVFMYHGISVGSAECPAPHSISLAYC
jgi:hypothetical protein